MEPDLNYLNSEEKKDTDDQQKEKEPLSTEETTLLLHGYKKYKYVADTLQGHVIMAYKYPITNNERIYVVIKTSNKLLHSQRITFRNMEYDIKYRKILQKKQN